MTKIQFFTLLSILFIAISCNKKLETKILKILPVEILPELKIPIDSATIDSFYVAFPKLSKYQANVTALYKKQKSTQLWLDNKGTTEFSNTLYDKYIGLDQEGLKADFQYNDAIKTIFENNTNLKLSPANTDVMISNLYFYYAEKMYNGVDKKTTTSLEWLLPRKEINYQEFSDSIFKHKSINDSKRSKLFSQYYKLRDVLHKFREIEKKGGWKPIEVALDFKNFKKGDSTQAIVQIRERLFITGELKENSKSPIYDSDLVAAVKKYQFHHGNTVKEKISPELIAEMNIPISERIKTITVNMERCRWIDPKLEKDKEFIEVNIPEFRLYLIRDGKISFVSPVVVGKSMTKTVIFSGMMNNIVFSPYWNVPQSIINKEIKPSIERDKDYLEKKNLEWNNGQVRQLPGENNSLGLVKFLFPNSNNIYLHDTPSKSLFEKESRAFSHGCVRVGKPKELAIELLKNDPNWSPKRIDKAMHSGKEQWCSLRKKIPVYIGYFTAWVDREGNLNFYKDVYQRDDRLAKLIYGK